jgi:hypothetical protein
VCGALDKGVIYVNYNLSTARHWKIIKCVQIIEESLRKNPNRLIFTNIIGLNIPGVLPIVSSANKPFDVTFQTVL